MLCGANRAELAGKWRVRVDPQKSTLEKSHWGVTCMCIVSILLIARGGKSVRSQIFTSL